MFRPLCLKLSLFGLFQPQYKWCDYLMRCLNGIIPILSTLNNFPFDLLPFYVLWINSHFTYSKIPNWQMWQHLSRKKVCRQQESFLTLSVSVCFKCPVSCELPISFNQSSSCSCFPLCLFIFFYQLVWFIDFFTCFHF